MIIKRIYQKIIEYHILSGWSQMIFLNGARQVGKTTLVRDMMKGKKNTQYLNFDNFDDKKKIISGYDKILENINLSDFNTKPSIIFDEIHKYGYAEWKNYLKGFFDTYKDKINIIVTGSSRLDVYQKGGDSMAGRYFLYHVLPITVGELINLQLPSIDKLYNDPKKLEDDIFDQLYRFGGFPDPFVKNSGNFHKRWQNLHIKQIFREDIRELSNIKDVMKMETLGALLATYGGKQIQYKNLCTRLHIDYKTLKTWIITLQNFSYCFFIQPYSNNIARSLIKEPKVYLYDWSLVDDKGAKFENFIAVHLYKTISLWNNIGLGEFKLHYLRDKEKFEVDFLIIKDNKPWIMVECKYSYKEPISKALYRFKEKVQPKHIFQVVYDLPFIEKDCFLVKEPTIIPAKTFLSQLF